MLVVQISGAHLIYNISLLGAAFGCIYTHPQQVTGYAGKRLTYICDANCGEKFWRINNSIIISEGMYPYEAVIGGSGQRSTLSVEASAATNNTLVTCWVFNPPSNVESSVTIIVQGTTAGPANLLFNYDENYANFSWSRPFILPNTEVEFTVNVSTERNFSLFTTADTQLSFPYTMLDFDPCPLSQTLTISVAGVNGAGEGEPSIIQPVITQTEENCIQGSSVIWIVVGVTLTGVLTTLLAIGVSVIIVVLVLRRYRSMKMLATSDQEHNASMNENNAYGVALTSNDAYGCDSVEEPHLYEEINVKKPAEFHYDYVPVTTCNFSQQKTKN